MSLLRFKALQSGDDEPTQSTQDTHEPRPHFGALGPSSFSSAASSSKVKMGFGAVSVHNRPSQPEEDDASDSEAEAAGMQLPPGGGRQRPSSSSSSGQSSGGLRGSFSSQGSGSGGKRGE